MNDIHVIHDCVDRVFHHSVFIRIHRPRGGCGGTSGSDGLAGEVGTNPDKEGEVSRGKSADDVGASGAGKEGSCSECHTGNHKTVGELVPESAGLGDVINITGEDLETVFPHACSANREADHHGHGNDSGEDVKVKVAGYSVVRSNGAKGVETQKTTDDASRRENYTVHIVGQDLTVVTVIHLTPFRLLATGLLRPHGPWASPSRPFHISAGSG
ncbi:hypothetical protein CBD41_03225 [bacterium TMED181]|nr:hypothetical protein [Planctomycetota bacterium]OUW45957.1 MAG: hypothetical protein CBD41_03225 [bacterium TMED181]